jgi:hypothetical protein
MFTLAAVISVVSQATVKVRSMRSQWRIEYFGTSIFDTLVCTVRKNKDIVDKKNSNVSRLFFRAVVYIYPYY